MDRGGQIQVGERGELFFLLSHTPLAFSLRLRQRHAHELAQVHVLSRGRVAW